MRATLYDALGIPPSASDEDFRAALDFMAGEHPGLELWAAGFSFGSHVAMTAGAADDRVCALIGIAPPVDRYDFAAWR